MAENSVKSGTVFCGILAGGIVLDQLTKAWSVGRLRSGPDIWLIRNVLCFTYTQNEGAAFSMMWGKKFFLLFFTACILAVIMAWAVHLIRSGEGLFPVILAGMVAAGAAGNLIDRIFRGYVVDFIYFAPIDFPVFNIADILVVSGCIGLIILVLLNGDDRKENK